MTKYRLLLVLQIFIAFVIVALGLSIVGTDNLQHRFVGAALGLTVILAFGDMWVSFLLGLVPRLGALGPEVGLVQRVVWGVLAFAGSFIGWRIQERSATQQEFEEVVM